jgi:protocatechuate 3,4-dioxygenase beta subunit
VDAKYGTGVGSGGLNRRELIERCLARGALVLAGPITVMAAADAFADPLPPTPFTMLGPNYRRAAPNRANLRQDGDPGLPLKIAGRVFSETGTPLPEARIEVWQTDAAGNYDLDGDRYRADFAANAEADYEIDTVMPGHYPGTLSQHVHYVVRAPGHTPLVTQVFFATDPVFDGDPGRNYVRDFVITSRELVRPVTLATAAASVLAQVTFDLVLVRR